MSRLCVRYSTDRYLQKKIKWSVNDMNMTASELREALLFDPETDSDLTVLEAACDVADMNYQVALESYADDYVMEGEIGAKVDAVKQFLKTLAQKIANWVRGVINAIKAKFKKMGEYMRKKIDEHQAKARSKTVDKSMKRLDKTGNQKASITVSYGEYTVINLLKTGEYGSSTRLCSELIDKLTAMEKPDIETKMTAAMTQSERDMQSLRKGKTEEKQTVSYDDVKTAMNNLIGVFDKVSGIAKSINNTANKLKKEADEKSIIIRTCCSRLANVQMKIARTLFSRTISVANRFAGSTNREEKKNARNSVANIRKNVRDNMANA